MDKVYIEYYETKKSLHIPKRYPAHYGRKLLNDIRNFFDKEPYQFVTIKEFVEYSGIEEEIVNKYLID